MKCIWDEDDIRNSSGTVVTNGDKAEHWMIGYVDGSGTNPVLVSLRDGMVNEIKGQGRAEFAKMLTERGMRPVVIGRRYLVENVVKGEAR
jgi:hypothetical protein